MPSLAEIQGEFARALADSGLPAPAPVRRGASSTSSRRFDVYRNNRAVNLVDALRSKFPAVRSLVGDDYFNAAARAFIDAHSPRSPVLLEYGQGFGDFLDTLPSASRVPYPGDVARLEAARLRALHAADAGPAAIERLGEVPGSRVDDVTLSIHPSAAVVASRWPVVSLWSAALDPDNAGEVNMKQPEQALVVRPALQVAVHRLPAGGEAFVDTLACGGTLGEAARRALEAADSFDLAAQIQLLFRAGAVAVVNLPESQKP